MDSSVLDTTYAAIAVIIVILYLIKLQKRYAKYSSVNSMPGPKITPIFGTSWEFYGISPAEGFKRMVKLQKASAIGMCRFWIGSPSLLWSFPTVVLTRADTVEKVLANSALTTKSALSFLFYDWLGKGILMSSGVLWHRRRKLLTPTFHFSILETFFPIMVDQTKVLVKKIESDIDSPIDVSQVLSNCTLDIIAQTAMGVDIRAQSNSQSDYVEALKDLDNIIVSRISGFWLLNGFIFSCTKIYKRYRECLDIIHSKSLEVIREKKEKLKSNVKDDSGEDQDEIPKKKKAFLDLLLEMNELSDQEMKEEVNTFMFAGQDTTSTTVKWCLFLLGHNQEIQERVQEELDDILQDEEDITEEDIKRMKYLECCIKESLRIYPAVPAIGRLLTQDLHINGYTIPSGTTVGMNMYVLHRDEKVFPDPEVYDPDRFLPENSVGRSPYAYVPFSAGNRNCIGQKFGMQESKVLLSMILRKFKVKSLLKREDINFTRNITLKCKETIHLKFSARE